MTTSSTPATGVARLVPAGAAAGRLLRVSFTGRALAELLYVLACAPLGVLGVAYVVVPFGYGLLFVLSITLVGLPILAGWLRGARRAGEYHRRLARRLLGTGVAAPPRVEHAPGFFGWLSSALSDATGWRAAAYLLLSGPVAVLNLAVVVVTWVYGALAVTYPAWRPFLPAEPDSRGLPHRGTTLAGDYYLDTWPRVVGVAVVGVVLLLAAPWAVRGALTVNRRLLLPLLGPTRRSQRIRDLERSRSLAVEDAAARLRRIERDLHDGAQARLAAVAMQLGAVKEEIAADNPRADLAEARSLVETAHRNAKDALDELRDLARGIHPPVLDSGLEAALTTLAARSAVPVELRLDVPHRPAAAIETIAYFCTAELLANVVKHSGAGQAVVTLTQHGGRLRLRVGDDGAGGADLRPGGGLVGLADRVGTVDGELEITSPPGGPTVVGIDLPCQV